MANKLTIWNRALAKLGERRVTSLTEDSPNSRKLSATYDEDRRSLLAMHAWKFATKEGNLAQNVSGPLKGYSNSFELPNDFIKLVSLNNIYPSDRNTPFFKILGDKIHTDETEAKISYVYDLENEGLFSPLFVEALSSFMAWNLSFSVSSANSEALSNRFQLELGRAKVADAQGDRSYRPSLYSFPNLGARLGGRPQ